MPQSYSSKLIPTTAADSDMLQTPMLKRLITGTHAQLGQYAVWVPALRVSEVEHLMGEDLQLWDDYRVPQESHERVCTSGDWQHVFDYSTVVAEHFNRDLPIGRIHAVNIPYIHLLPTGCVDQSLTFPGFFGTNEQSEAVRCAAVVFDALLGDLNAYDDFCKTADADNMPQALICTGNAWDVGSDRMRKDMRERNHKVSGLQRFDIPFIETDEYQGRYTLSLYTRLLTKYKRPPRTTIDGEPVKRPAAECYAISPGIVNDMLYELTDAVNTHLGCPGLMDRRYAGYDTTGWRFAGESMFLALRDADTLGLLPLLYTLPAYTALVTIVAGSDTSEEEVVA